MRKQVTPPRSKGPLLSLLDLLLIVLFAGCAFGNDIDRQLNAELRDKILTLRHFYSGSDLQFDLDGQTLVKAEPGSWTTDAEVHVESVVLRGRTLTIKGNRIFVFFDGGSGEFRDIFSVRKNEQAAKYFKHLSTSLKALSAEKRVKIAIEFASERPGLDEIHLALDNIFLREHEELSSVVPEFWRTYFAYREGRSNTSTFEDNVSEIKRGTSAPRPLSTSDPDYSEVARIAGYSQSIELSLVVDNEGCPQDIQIVKPAGLGLDERAAQAVRDWKFLPAQNQAQAVPVRLKVSVTFRLY